MALINLGNNSAIIYATLCSAVFISCSSERQKRVHHHYYNFSFNVSQVLGLSRISSGMNLSADCCLPSSSQWSSSHGTESIRASEQLLLLLCRPDSKSSFLMSVMDRLGSKEALPLPLNPVRTLLCKLVMLDMASFNLSELLDATEAMLTVSRPLWSIG